MLKKKFNIVSGLILRKIRLFFVSFVIVLTSCSNEHCDEVMYAPLIVDFFTEYDDTPAQPSYFMAIGIGTDSVLDFSGKTRMELPLNMTSNISEYAVAIADKDVNYVPYLIINDSTFYSTDNTIVIRKKIDDIYFEKDFNRYWQMTDDSDTDDSYLFLRAVKFDTLTVKYANQYEFVSAECGCLATQILLDFQFKNRNIGIAQIVNPLIRNNNANANVEIFLENY